jgi:hypothetical protein
LLRDHLFTEEIHERWVAALRGGKYQQGMGRLRYSHGQLHGPGYAYCCLGVLGDLMVESGKWAWENNNPGEVECWQLRAGFELSPAGRLPYSAVSGPGGHHQRELIRLNDLAEASFLAIADYIEARIHPQEGA